jgi:NDP-sugar pyrophosphorylase family protein
MKAMLLCAGSGTRLRPLTLDCPKPMVKIQGKPLLEYHIEWLSRYGITDIAINLHYLPGAIRGYFGDGRAYGVRIRYSYEDELRGTAGALVPLRDFLDETFVVHYADIYSEVDIARMQEFHRCKRSVATLAVHESTHPEDSDIAQIDGQARVQALYHKPGHRDHGILGNAGMYILEPSVLEYVPEDRIPTDFIRDVFPLMVAAGQPVYGYDTSEFLQDMGTYERYEKLVRRLAKS